MKAASTPYDPVLAQHDLGLAQDDPVLLGRAGRMSGDDSALVEPQAVVAARFDDDEAGKRGGQRRRWRRNGPKGHGGGLLPHQPGGSPGGAGERGSRRRGVGVRPGAGLAACRVADARVADGGW
jgi:hypothetical protein